MKTENKIKAAFTLSTGSGIGAHLKQLQLAFSICEKWNLDFSGVYGVGSRSGRIEKNLFEPILINSLSQLKNGKNIIIDNNLINTLNPLDYNEEMYVFNFQGWDYCRDLIVDLQKQGIFKSDVISKTKSGIEIIAHISQLLKTTISSSVQNFFSENQNEPVYVVHLRLGDTAVLRISDSLYMESWKIPSIKSCINHSHYPLADNLFEVIIEFIKTLRTKKSNAQLVLITDGFESTFSRANSAIIDKNLYLNIDDLNGIKIIYENKLNMLKSKFEYSIVGESETAVMESIFFLLNAKLVLRTHGSFADSITSLLRYKQNFQLQNLLTK